ncbi:hypothetical protein GCM10009133_38270 [Cocleimonas flava]|uniref:Copper(I)-binding protein n=2 Tax=Cocleimonas flava TaxID=634765 RepID=A0A4R1F6X8_9GAMM|nr:copper(I)-binding protein [Cocleimonas flava]
MNKNTRMIDAIKRLFWLFVFVSCTVNVMADNSSTISTQQLRVILPPPVATSAAAYGVIENTGNVQDTLINISSDAGMIMLHKSEIIDGMAKMNHVEDYVFEPGAQLILKPMSYHLMFMNINHDVIKQDGEVLVTLEFEKAGKLKINVPVSAE